MGHPDGSVERFTYDAVGNVATHTTRAGQVMTCTYNNRNLDTLCDWNDTTPDVAKTYDTKARVVTISNGLTAITKSYHVNGDLATETLDIGLINGTDPAPRTITYGSDSDGNRLQAVYPGGTGLIYRYSQRNQLSAIEEDGPPPLVSYTYDAAGNRITKSLENGTLTNYAYDNGGRLTSIDHIKAGVSFARFDYGYNTVNAAKYVKRDSARGDAFTYDGIDQVIGVQYDALTPDTTPSAPLRTESFAYDSAGNRQTATESGVTQAYSVDSSNRYIQVGSATIGSDANGNLTTGFAGYTYTYDAENRLKTSSGPGGVVILTYDGLNRCIARTVNGASTFCYFDDWNLIEERDGSGALLRKYVHGSVVDEVLSIVRADGASYYQQDRLGSTVKLTNGLGNVGESYTYDAYGVPTLRDTAGTVIVSSQAGNRFMFTGRERRSEMGLYDYRSRVYAPEIGRFVQSDPIGFGGGDSNLYRYVNNEPTNETDPDGRIAIGIPGFGPTSPGYSNNDFSKGFRMSYGSGTVRIFGRSSLSEAIAAIMAAREEGDCQIQIGGYSRGAIAALQIAKALKRKGINVDTLLLIDPITVTGFLSGGKIKIPTNVRSGLNVYQTGQRMGITDFPGAPAGPGNVTNFHMPENWPLRGGVVVRHETLPILTWRHMYGLKL